MAHNGMRFMPIKNIICVTAPFAIFNYKIVEFIYANGLLLHHRGCNPARRHVILDATLKPKRKNKETSAFVM